MKITAFIQKKESKELIPLEIIDKEERSIWSSTSEEKFFLATGCKVNHKRKLNRPADTS